MAIVTTLLPAPLSVRAGTRKALTAIVAGVPLVRSWPEGPTVDSCRRTAAAAQNLDLTIGRDYAMALSFGSAVELAALLQAVGSREARDDCGVTSLAQARLGLCRARREGGAA